jgi:phage-related protein
LSSADARYATAGILGGEGQAILSLTPDRAIREIAITGWFEGSTRAVLLGLVDALKRWTEPPKELTVAFGDDLTRAYVGRRTGFKVVVSAPQYVNLRAKVTLSVSLIDKPFGQATSATTTAFTNTPTAMPIGTARVAPLIETTAVMTNPRIKLRNAAGTVIADLIFTVSLPGGGDKLSINCATGLITKTVSAVVTDAMATFTPSSDFPLVLDPADGDQIAGTWSTLAITVDSGTPAANAIYSKLYG